MIDQLLDDLHRASAAVQSSLPALSDDDLLRTVERIEIVGRSLDAARVRAASELERRCTAGYSGLAVRLGHRTPDRLLASLTGTSRSEASRRLRVGASPAVDAAVTAGILGLEQADAIARTLADVDSPRRAAAVDALVASAAPADELLLQARAVRDALTAVDPLHAEAALRARRYLRFGREVDGMRPLHALLDPESAAVLVAAMDAATAPRRGGPRFVDAPALPPDDRSADQLRLDALVDLVRVASAVGDAPVFGAARPAVRVVVSSAELAAGTAHLDGIGAVSAATARRLACDAGMLPVVLGTDGQVLDVGRRSRTFTPAQRIALAVRDGGCRWPDCDRPPSWCEAHHLVEWSRGGPTSVDNGVLLCRHHHLLIHNNGWRVSRTPAGLAAIPPPAVDPARQPWPMPTKSPVAREVMRR